MSLCAARRCGARGRFPRVSGDEPVPPEVGEDLSAFSPRERG